ncbi:MAG: TRAP transporter small permease [Magnetospirillum sp.]|nr:TRAP transporter small permease [Magnetospirillum sp.]
MPFTGFERRAADAGLALACAAAGLTLGLMLLEVALRYVFSAPTVWTPELVGMTNGAIFVFAAGPALRAGAHVSVDALTRFLPTRARDGVLAVFFAGLLLPALIVLIDAGIGRAWTAFARGEVNDVSPWRHAVWPHYALLTLGLSGLALQVAFEAFARAKRAFG